MLIIISPEHDNPNEIEILRMLFKNGLKVFHLRKPHKTVEGIRNYLKAIPQAYHSRIMLHTNHELMTEFNVRGLHFTEENRDFQLRSNPDIFNAIKNQGKWISSSFHNIKDLERCSVQFDYHILSPVFNAVSKAGYLGQYFNVVKQSKQIIALGGVTENTLRETIQLGYNGAAVLGSVWNSSTPVIAYLKLKHKLTTLTIKGV